MVKVLYIIGSSRCGSTVLANILGELDGFFNGGEIRFLWSRVLQGRRCGCGRPVEKCPIWESVLSTASQDRDEMRAIAEAQRASLRLHRWPALLRQPRRELLQSPQVATYVRALHDVYDRLTTITGARVIVDSSKRPSNAAALRLIEGISPYFLHLVRDSRGVAYSHLRWKENPDGAGEMPMASSWVNALDWTATNLAASDVRRHVPQSRRMFLRYEDFIRDPKPTIEGIATFVGARAQPDPFTGPHTVDLGENHTVSGNADRFRRGSVTLRADVEWIDRMGSFDRRLTTALTVPLLLRYRYPLRPSSIR